jgi:hypothetical protein
MCGDISIANLAEQWRETEKASKYKFFFTNLKGDIYYHPRMNLKEF